jgi:hypothetical protein
MEIWEPKSPGTLWATPGLLRDPFTFDTRNTIKIFSYANAFQATLALFARVRTGVLLWLDNRGFSLL